MGGGDGNITPAAEYNFYVDPEAAKIVLQRRLPAHALHLDAHAHARRLRRRQAGADRRARHAARRLLRPGEPEGARVRRQGQPPRRLDASRLDGRRRDRRARRSSSRASEAVVDVETARRADARLEPDRHARPHRPRAERPRRHRLRHGAVLRAGARACSRDRVPAADPRAARAARHRPGADAALLPRAGGRARLRRLDPARRAARAQGRARPRRRGSRALAGGRAPRARLRAPLPDPVPRRAGRGARRR